MVHAEALHGDDGRGQILRRAQGRVQPVGGWAAREQLDSAGGGGGGGDARRAVGLGVAARSEGGPRGSSARAGREGGACIIASES